MAFPDEVIEAWQNDNQQRLAELFRLDYSPIPIENWEMKAFEFLAISEEAKVEAIKLFMLAKKVHEQLGMGSSFQWLSYIVPHLLNLYDARNFDEPTWTVAATGGSLPSTDWDEIQPWIADWLRRLIDLYSDNSSSVESKDSFGFYLPAQALPKYHPALFHPLVLRTLQAILDPTQPYTLQLMQWLVENVFQKPLDLVNINTVFAAGATFFGFALRIEASDAKSAMWKQLMNEVIQRFEASSSGDPSASAHWRGQDALVAELLDTSPLWQQHAVADLLRQEAHKRISSLMQAAIQSFAENQRRLPPALFRVPLEEVTVAPLPEYRSAVSATPYWSDKHFSELTASLEAIAALGAQQAKRIEAVATVNEDTAKARSAVQQLASKPLHRLVLPNLAAEVSHNPTWLSTNAVRVLTQQLLRFTPIESGGFPFDQGPSVADTSWKDAISAEVPLNDAAAIVTAWTPLDLWESLRARFLATPLAAEDERAAALLWKAVSESALLKVLAVDHPDQKLELNALATIANLAETRAKLSLLVLLGFPQWKTLAQLLDKRLPELEAQPDLAAYKMLAAARIELAITALTAGASPKEALPLLSGTSDEYQIIGRMIEHLFASTLAWETRAAMNGLILQARLAELTGDLFIANRLTDSVVDRAKLLVEVSINALLEGNLLPGSDLPLAFAAVDLLRYARERSAAITYSQLLKRLTWWPGNLSTLLFDLVEIFQSDNALQRFMIQGGLPLRLLLLTVTQIAQDHFARDQRLQVRPPSNLTTESTIGMESLYRLREATNALFSGEQLLLSSLPDDTIAELPWWQVEYWFRQRVGENELLVDEDSDKPRAAPPIAFVHWLATWSDEGLTALMSRAAWQGVNLPKRPLSWLSLYAAQIDGQPAPEMTPEKLKTYRNGIYASAFVRDIDGYYPGEMSYVPYQSSYSELTRSLHTLKEAEQVYVAALQQQVEGKRSDEIINLLSASLRLNTADFREQIQSALADVATAEAELEVAEHESLAAKFGLFASQMVTEAAKIEVEREQHQVLVQKIILEISKKDDEIARKKTEMEAGKITLAEYQIEVARLKVEQTRKRIEQGQSQLSAIRLEIEFIRKLLGAPAGSDPKTVETYQISFEIDGKPVNANGQIAAIALRTQDILSKQIDRQIAEAQAAFDVAKKKEKKAKKRAKRNKLISSACKFIGAVVGAVVGGGPAGAALGAQIGEAVAELTIGIMDNRPPMDILAGLVDNAFAIAGAAGFDLEAELNTLGKKAAAEVNSYLSDLTTKLQPLLDDLPNVLNQNMIQDALDILDLEDLNELPDLAKNLFESVPKDIKKAGEIGTILKGAVGIESAGALGEYLKTKLGIETRKSYAAFSALAERVGEQVDRLLTDPMAQEKAMDHLVDKVMEKAAPIVMGALASQAADIRASAIHGWLVATRDAGKYWDSDEVKTAGRELLTTLFPNDANARAAAEANLAAALLPQALYRGKIQQLLSPWQNELDRLLGEILAFEAPNVKKESEFWDAQKKHLIDVKTAFNGRLFEWMKGEPLDGKAHPRDELLNNLSELELDAEKALSAVQIEEIQKQIDDLGQDEAAKKLELAQKALEIAEVEVEKSQLMVNQESLFLQIANLSLKKAETIEKAEMQAENAARARADAAESKIVVARAKLLGKEALLNGARRRGLEAGRIRVLLDQPLSVLDPAKALAFRARRNYDAALQDALHAYRMLLRYFSATFFIEQDDDGALTLPKLLRPDLLEAQEETVDTWREALESWQKAVNDLVTDASLDSLIGIDYEVLFWDLTPQQIAAAASPDGLQLHFGPQVEEVETLFEIPFAYFAKDETGQLFRYTKEIAELFADNGFALSSDWELQQGTSGEYLLSDKERQPVLVVHHNNKGIAYDKGVTILAEPVAYDILSLSPTIYQVKRRVDQRRWTPSKKIGRSIPADRITRYIEPAIAQSGRIIALFVSMKDNNGKAFSDTLSYNVGVRFLGEHWIAHNQVNMQMARLLDSRRLIHDASLNTMNANNLKESVLREEAANKQKPIDGDIVLTVPEGTPIAGKSVFNLYFTQKLTPGRTVASISLVFLIKRYTSPKVVAVHSDASLPIA